jgi:hypothetical protein
MTRPAVGRGRYLDLSRPDHSYFFAFVQGDGHLYSGNGNRGCLTVELSAADQDVLTRFQSMFPLYSSIRRRQRRTNFAAVHDAAVWTLCSLAFRQELLELGLTPGRKSTTTRLPTVPFAEADYFRGWIDADGSVGVSMCGLPFVSLTTASDHIAAAYKAFAGALIGQPIAQRRNRRDGVYNILFFKENAQAVIDALYTGSSLALERKRARAVEALQWTRPATMRRVLTRQPWTPEQDRFVLSHTIDESARALGRTIVSVTLRRRRLRGLKKHESQPVTE